MHAICTVSEDSYVLMSDREWAHLLQRQGVDLSRPLRYSLSWGYCAVYYDDTFLGADI